MLTAWLQFIACAAVIAASGYQLARFGHTIALLTGLGGTWIGIILVATVTSLPELTTGLSAVAVAGLPDIAVGDALGSCVFNLALIGLLDFLHRDQPLYTRVSSGHILSAGFSVILLGLVVLGLLAGDGRGHAIGHVGTLTPAIVAIYLIAVRALYVQERRLAINPPRDQDLPTMTLRQAATGYGISAAIIVAAGLAMPFAAERLAVAMGWSQSFVGTLLVAAATSLPEAASTLGALRLGAIDLAIANLFGSNLFNVLILAIDDIAYVKGPLLAAASPSHAVSGVTAIIMTGIAIVGVHYRPTHRVMRVVGWSSLALLALYVLNAMILYLKGH